MSKGGPKLFFIIVILNINAIANVDVPLHENTYVPNSKQWIRLRYLKMWCTNKLTMIEVYI